MSEGAQQRDFYRAMDLCLASAIKSEGMCESGHFRELDVNMFAHVLAQMSSRLKFQMIHKK